MIFICNNGISSGGTPNDMKPQNMGLGYVLLLSSSERNKVVIRSKHYKKLGNTWRCL